MQSSHCDSSVAIFEMEISLQFETAPSSKHQKASASTDHRAFFSMWYAGFNHSIPFRGKNLPLSVKKWWFFFSMCIWDCYKHLKCLIKKMHQCSEVIHLCQFHTYGNVVFFFFFFFASPARWEGGGGGGNNYISSGKAE